VTDQRYRQAFASGAAGTTDAVHILIAGTRHIEVDHQIQAFDIQAARCHIGGHQHLDRALTQALDGQLAILLILLAVQDERLDPGRHQFAVETISLDAGVGEDDGLVVGLIGQQPIHKLFLVVVVVGRDDLLASALVELADAVEHQVLRFLEHLGDHLAQAIAASGGGEQQCLVRATSLGQALGVLGKAHVEHTVGFVEHQHLDLIQRQVTGVGMLDQPAWRADQDIDLAHHRGLHLEVLAPRHQAGLEEGELGETLDFLERLLRQLTGRQQNQRANAQALLGVAVAEQPIEQRQDESGGLAAAGLGDHPQILALQCGRNRCRLHRSRLDEIKLGHGFQQAVMQGELGKHGSTTSKNRQNGA
jgi:hypothetical protein